MTGRAVFLVFLLVVLAHSAAAGAEEVTCGVRYLSAEHVYLDAGSGAGLSVGMTARVVREGQAIAELEVVFTAEHSASCRIVSSSAEILAGDHVVYEVAEMAPAVVVAPPPQRTRAGFETEAQVVSRKGPSVSGSIALQWDHTDETADRGLETNLYSLPFRVRVSRLGNMMEFRARGSVRRIQRSGYYSSTPDKEWRNRIQEVALVRDGRELDWHFGPGARRPRTGLAFLRGPGRWALHFRSRAFRWFEYQSPRWQRNSPGSLRRFCTRVGGSWVRNR